MSSLTLQLSESRTAWAGPQVQAIPADDVVAMPLPPVDRWTVLLLLLALIGACLVLVGALGLESSLARV